MQLQPTDYELSVYETSGEVYQRRQWYRRGRAMGFLYGSLFATVVLWVIFNWLF